MRAQMKDFVGKEPPKRSPGASRSQRERHIEEVRERIRTKEWDGLTAGKLVALYWIVHKEVYECYPVELDKAVIWTRAMQAAGKMVNHHFDGDVQRALTFMRWVWHEEERIEEWRKRSGAHGSISWKNQFYHDYLITKWRQAAARRRR